MRILHTGQHYDDRLDSLFFSELELPPPAGNLAVGSLEPPEQLGAILGRAGPVLRAWRPKWVLVQGDTNSTLGCALAAYKSGLPVAHLEAGLRSDDLTMPEEMNRILADRLAELHFVPTECAFARLKKEGLGLHAYVVGNTAVDAVHLARERRGRSRVLDRLELEPGSFAIVTLHRPSNVDRYERLRSLLEGIEAFCAERDLLAVWPVHPRIASVFDLSNRWREVKPLGYFDFQRLLSECAIALTDSGGVQEEACTLGVGCLTLRENTERPETVECGANVLCPNPAALGVKADALAGRWVNPLGDGRAAERVAALLG